MQRFKLAVLAVTLMFGATTAPIHAATIFTDSGTFETATGGSTLTDDYNDFVGGINSLPTVTDRGDYQLIEAAGQLFQSAGGIPSNVNGTGFFGISIPGTARLEFDTPITAMGFEYRTDSLPNELVVESGSFSTSIFASSTAQFFGVLFDAPVTSVDVRNAGDRLSGLDNLRAVAVPEPTSVSLAMIGIALLATRRGRRFRNTGLRLRDVSLNTVGDH